MSDREIRPVSRFEWEQIMRRARLGGLIKGNGNGTRGGVSGQAFKAVALVWASYANPDGSSIHPGDATLAVEAEVGLKIAKAVKAKLIELGLTARTKAGARRSRLPDIYCLTLPSDLFENVTVLSPTQLKVAAMAEYEKQRGKRGGSTGPLKDPIDPDAVQGPQDPQQGDPAEILGGPMDPPNGVVGGPMDPLWGVRRTAIPTNDRANDLPDQSDEEVRTDLTGPRATPPEPDSDVVAAPGRSRCEHGLPAGRRGDGRPSCALCRVAEDKAKRSVPTPAALARVVQMRPTA